ncbi:Hypothetical protein SMAX5B_013025 [Scophthalmus maximus]|uniref:Secreted protein n=1 Tax=Scophthalmus maximus TaxID=52904 RepID=A0A2U9BHS1_SCOMX|nr:Hypothetical protein SMAX5B_013025 [Scophthalmus maximus]
MISGSSGLLLLPAFVPFGLLAGYGISSTFCGGSDVAGDFGGCDWVVLTKAGVCHADVEVGVRWYGW